MGAWLRLQSWSQTSPNAFSLHLSTCSSVMVASAKMGGLHQEPKDEWGRKGKLQPLSSPPLWGLDLLTMMCFGPRQLRMLHHEDASGTMVCCRKAPFSTASCRAIGGRNGVTGCQGASWGGRPQGQCQKPPDEEAPDQVMTSGCLFPHNNRTWHNISRFSMLPRVALGATLAEGGWPMADFSCRTLALEEIGCFT